MTKTYRAVAPDGVAYTFKTTRQIGFASFTKLPDGRYHPFFAKTIDAARRAWGAKGVGLVRATEI